MGIDDNNKRHTWRHCNNLWNFSHHSYYYADITLFWSILMKEIRKKIDVMKLFGSIKLKRSSQEMKNEAREGWDI